MSKPFMLELWNAVAPAVIALAAYLALQVRERIRARAALQHAPVEEQQVTDRTVRDLLGELRQRLGADRAYLSKFHNGEKYADDSDILKKSRTHEVCGPGISPDAQRFRNLLVSDVPDEMAMVIEEGPSYRRVGQMHDSSFKWRMVEGGVFATARAGIRKGRDLVAFVGVDFIHRKDEPPDIELMVEYAGRIGQVMSKAWSSQPWSRND